MWYRYIESRIGQLLLAGDDAGLKIIGFPQGKGRVMPDPFTLSFHDEFGRWICAGSAGIVVRRP